MSAPTPYSPPRFDTPIDLDLSRNEGRPPAPGLIERLAEPTALIGRYPDTGDLRSDLASMHGLEPGRVLVTAGGDDALFRCFLARVGPGSGAVTTYPSFEMIPRYTEQVGGKLTEVSWWEGTFPTDDLIGAITPDTAAVVVVSPNNPTGAVIDEASLVRVAAASPLVILDAAYAEFSDQDLTAVALGLGNVVVIRTLSKAWGLAGLRVGYLLGPAELIAEIGAYGSPYAVTGLSQALARRRLTAVGEVGNFVATVRQERSRLMGELEELGVETQPSQANFLLARFPDPEWAVDAAASLGIGLRRFPNRPGLESHVRVSLPGDGVSLDRVIHALATALQPQALLFDLDGVLADVEPSQTAAMIETAAVLGAAVTRDDVALARSAGNANDDWQLTRRLIEAAGVTVSLSEVTDRYEKIYQGTSERPGLKRRERPLLDPKVFARWAERFPLAVVTGRPRSDAEEFLEQSGLGRWASVLVTREDAPLKPDPAPVRLALQRLGVERAWMLGDTPDDIDAAREAGVVPIGVHTPGRDQDLTERSLNRAARILGSPAELEELLP